MPYASIRAQARRKAREKETPQTQNPLTKNTTQKGFKVVKQIRELKQGEFFKLKDTESAPVWVRDEYDKSSRKYWIYKFDDVNHGREIKGTTVVYTAFTF